MPNMNTRPLLPAVVLAGLLLSGCQTMSPNECKVANWSDLGLRDGLAGKPLSLLDERAHDCAEAGVAADTPRYLAGRDQGLREYCRIENAIPLGLNGSSYEGVCPPLLDVEFRRRHQAAYAVHDLRGSVEDLDRRSARLQHELREVDADEAKRLKAADKDDDRKRIRAEADERREKLRHELREMDKRLRHARDDLRSAEYVLDTMR